MSQVWEGSVDSVDSVDESVGGIEWERAAIATDWFELIMVTPTPHHLWLSSHILAHTCPTPVHTPVRRSISNLVSWGLLPPFFETIVRRQMQNADVSVQSLKGKCEGQLLGHGCGTQV